jgi:hypothetical protein
MCISLRGAPTRDTRPTSAGPVARAQAVAPVIELSPTKPPPVAAGRDQKLACCHIGIGMAIQWPLTLHEGALDWSQRRTSKRDRRCWQTPNRRRGSMINLPLVLGTDRSPHQTVMQMGMQAVPATARTGFQQRACLGQVWLQSPPRLYDPGRAHGARERPRNGCRARMRSRPSSGTSML